MLATSTRSYLTHPINLDDWDFVENEKKNRANGTFSKFPLMIYSPQCCNITPTAMRVRADMFLGAEL